MQIAKNPVLYLLILLHKCHPSERPTVPAGLVMRVSMGRMPLRRTKMGKPSIILVEQLCSERISFGEPADFPSPSELGLGVIYFVARLFGSIVDLINPSDSA